MRGRLCLCEKKNRKFECKPLIELKSWQIKWRTFKGQTVVKSRQEHFGPGKKSP